jgi:molybdenum cofactor cytidylyltransferase
MITAIVVAAGKSVRMGPINKLSLPFANSTILGTVINQLLESKADEIILVHGDESIDYLHHKGPRLRMAQNKTPDAGLTSSIQTGVRTARPDNALLICLGDMPLLTTANYNSVLKNYIVNYIENYIVSDKKVILQPKKGQHTGNPVLFSPDFRNDILSLDSPNGCKPIVQSNQQYVRKIPVNSDAFFTDIDNKDQYDEIIKKLAAK